MTPAVMALGPWRTNGDMIADVARVGYLNPNWVTLDMTYGLGRWWTRFRPHNLHGIDLDPAKALDGKSTDCRAVPMPDGFYDVVAFDPPYKLNGRPTPQVDAPYGVDQAATVGTRHGLLVDGLTEADRLTMPGGYILVKVQDQVAGGRVRWQTDIATRHAESLGLDKVDAFLFQSYRSQPKGRTQQHARRNYSTLLVFRKAP